MRPVHETRSEIPDLELRGACIACGGDLSIRLRPGLSRCLCRDCGCQVWAVVEHGDEGVEMGPAAGAEA